MFNQHFISAHGFVDKYILLLQLLKHPHKGCKLYHDHFCCIFHSDLCSTVLHTIIIHVLYVLCKHGKYTPFIYEKLDLHNDVSVPNDHGKAYKPSTS